MEINKKYALVVVFLVLTQVGLASASLGDFFDQILTPITSAFNSVHDFLIKIEIVFLNIVEVLLFLVFIFLLVLMFIVPARVYAYAKEFSAPFRMFFDWVKK